MTTFVRVEMLAFCPDPDTYRLVAIPSEVQEGVEPGSPQFLELVYYYGQNEFQPREMPSVSMGDVVHYQDRYFLVAVCGFKELTPAELREYRKVERVDRSFCELVRG